MIKASKIWPNYSDCGKMCKFFLLNEAVDLPEFDVFLQGMLELNAIERGEYKFHKHDSIYDTDNYSKLCSSKYSQDNQLILQFIQQLTCCDTYLKDEQTADELWRTHNAFLGIDFSKTSISEHKQVTDNDSFHDFISTLLFNCDFRDFWKRKKELLPDLIFCDSVKQSIQNAGNSSHFNQILTKLKILNDIARNWQKGKFRYHIANQNHGINISPETPNTMAKYGTQRTFQLPEGGSQEFNLHVKTGGLRFHFYPNEQNRKIYIGYIGPHLRTVKYK